ncbi:MAG: AAA family ATPase [Spirochaetes bacterium]|uniref:AAA family ATPase n=1 Tax=Candidatus Ornithospirochaeta stercoripullorum TaxID=2840899 RepID=A0A9D9E119_9SPIO|nr:AAA family ATPase [Candidatus Ornithospirochaeta stercoripullorum]
MEKRIKLPIGVTDFREIISKRCYYIDKTHAISELIEDGSQSILFTRPRRFGKTTFQSMLRAFFDIREDNRDIFDGLEIMEDTVAVENWMNKVPVIYLTLKDVDGLDFDSAFNMLKGKLTSLFQDYDFISVPSDDEEGMIFRNMCKGRATTGDASRSLEILAKLLYKHYGKKVIILIDEYDVPLDKAEKNGYYTEMLSLMRTMLLSVLKDCPYTEKGILTGCLRISKESLFTGLNNLSVHSVTGDEYADAFGFTEAEVAKLLKDAELEDKAGIIQDWYDGYNIGKEHIYTPWDVISYVNRLQVNRDAEPENYWANSSGNDVIRRLIDITDAEVGDDYSSLIEGRSIRKKIIETLTYHNLYSSEENIWSLLLMTGYLTLAGGYNPNGETVLKLPNEEIRYLFASLVDEWFKETVRKSDRKGLFEAIWNVDAEELSSVITSYLFDTISYYDYREDYYHAFLAGLLSGAGYTVKSNRETGSGRADIILLDKRNRQVAIFELKRSESEGKMEEDAKKALRQIEERRYGSDLQGYKRIIRYGVAFYQKEALVKTFPS